MDKVFVVDPQARGKGSLAVYDYNLFSRMNNYDLTLFGNRDCEFKHSYENLNYRGIFYYHRYKGVIKGLSYLWSMIVLLFHIIKKKPVAIHIEWIRLWPVDFSIYWLISKFSRVRLVYTVHNILPHNHKNRDVNHYRRLYSLMDKLVVHTETSKNDLLIRFCNISSDDVYVIPHGILQLDVDKKDVKYAQDYLSKKHHIEGKFIISIIGTQSRYKGTDLLLEAWKRCPELYNNEQICLILAGKFSSEVLPQDVPNNVIVDNRIIPEEEFVAYIRMSDVIVLPYREIDQSGVLLTIFNEHIPYCATNVGELCKPLEISSVGWTIPSISSEAICERLLYIVNHMDEVREKKHDKESWDKIHSLYDWDTISTNTEALYQN